VTPITILGAGPAGSSAAIAARLDGHPVDLIDKSKFPRHKVCGEFLSPEIEDHLNRLGVWDAFLASAPARIHRMKLHFGRREKLCRLPDPAWGLSRFTFDALLFDRARHLGATILRDPPAKIAIDATGRHAPASTRGKRLFGFKAHFEGPADDAVELFFADHWYVGINAVEAGRTNVCGLAPEHVLAKYDFDFDRLVRESPALTARLAPLTRSMRWISTGPLQYAQKFNIADRYLAGDALSFVDPFTGSGLLGGLRTGSLAGTAAVRAIPIPDYLAQCRKILKSQFQIASILRETVSLGWAERLVGLLPGRLLFALTRPHT
jgi:flavin-dependent dehydrogenase